MNKLDAGEICRELETLRSGGADTNELFTRAMTLLHDSNEQFDWTGIYELHTDGMLRLGPYVGESTAHVQISVGQGVCGTAVANNCTMNIPDVSKATNYLACSTATKSELVVLIRRNGRIYAQIDIDSHEIDAFSHETVQQVEELADWLAVVCEEQVGERAGVS